MDVSLLQEKSTFPDLTMRMSPHLEPFFFKFMTVFYINAVQYQTSTISRI